MKTETEINLKIIFLGCIIFIFAVYENGAVNETFGFRTTSSTDSGEEDDQLVVDGTLVVASKYDCFIF